MNTFVLICAYLYIYIHDLGKCVQIIYTVTCVNMLIYWILVIFLYMCVCNLFLGRAKANQFCSPAESELLSPGMRSSRGQADSSVLMLQQGLGSRALAFLSRDRPVTWGTGGCATLRNTAVQARKVLGGSGR